MNEPGPGERIGVPQCHFARRVRYIARRVINALATRTPDLEISVWDPVHTVHVSLDLDGQFDSQGDDIGPRRRTRLQLILEGFNLERKYLVGASEVYNMYTRIRQGSFGHCSSSRWEYQYVTHPREVREIEDVWSGLQDNIFASAFG